MPPRQNRSEADVYACRRRSKCSFSSAFAERYASVPPDGPQTISFATYNLASASAGADATKELLAAFKSNT